MVDANGEVHVAASPLIGELVLPKSAHHPVLLEKGYLEATSPTAFNVTR